MHKIIDEFTALEGKVSRQRIWQLRRQRDGRCIICGDPALPGGYRCQRHLDANRRSMLIRSRNISGIPVDAPLKKTGRPRKW